mgnify:CR=1 FL=1
MNFNQDKNNIKIEDLYFYFDSQQKDLLDFSSDSNKIIKILNLKTKLLNLPKDEFIFVINTVEKILNHNKFHEQTSKKNIKTIATNDFKDAQKLFKSINSQNGLNTPINEIQKL